MNLDKLLPSKDYILTTQLSMGEVSQRIANDIHTDHKYTIYDLPNPLTRQFKGVVKDDMFQIHQSVISRQNSFAPLITGIMNERDNLTFITISMQVLPLAKTLTLLWLGLLGFVCVFLLLIGLLIVIKGLPIPSNPFLLIPFIMFGLGWYFVFGWFKTENFNSRRYLVNLLSGQEEDIEKTEKNGTKAD